MVLSGSLEASGHWGESSHVRNIRIRIAAAMTPGFGVGLPLALLSSCAVVACFATAAVAADPPTLPKPDPPPTTRKSPSPQLPPPPTPARTYSPPPSGASTYVPPARSPSPAQPAVVAPFTPPSSTHHQPAAREKKKMKHHPKVVAVTVPIRGIPPRDIPEGPALVSAIVPAATVSSPSASAGVPALLWIVLALSLIAVGLAMAPRWALPRPFAIIVAERRESLLYTGTATVIVIGLCLFFAVGQS